MKLESYIGNIQVLKFQRNIFLSLTLVLSIAIIILSVSLFFKKERIVMVPPVVNKTFWVDSNTVSPTYLEQYALFISQLLLTKSSESASAQGISLLRQVDPAFYGVLRKRLIEEEDLLKMQESSYVFFPVDIQVDMKNLEVLLIGDRSIHMKDRHVTTSREGYLLQFSYDGSQVKLSSITSVEVENGHRE